MRCGGIGEHELACPFDECRKGQIPHSSAA